MQRKSFKKINDKLGFNTPGSDTIFMILHETEAGFMYILESSPFGSVNFVHRDLVEDETPVEEAPVEHKNTTRKG